MARRKVKRGVDSSYREGESVRAKECVKVFNDCGIKAPTFRDYETILIPYLRNKPGRSKNTFLCAKTIEDYVRETKKYYKDRQLQEDAEQAYLSEDISARSAISDDGGLPLSLGVISGIDAGEDDHVQFSVCLRPETYESIRDISMFSGQNVSDIVSKAVDSFVLLNRDGLNKVRTAVRQLKIIY